MRGYRSKGWRMLGAVALVAALVGCAHKVAAAIPSADSAPIFATSAAQPLASPVVSATPSPTVTPAPNATPQPWTPGPLATADKIAYDTMSRGGPYDDYIVVEQNGLQGLVGADGHVILPCTFASVEPVDYYWNYWHDIDDRSPAPKKALFFVVPLQVNPAGQHEHPALGWLCDDEGRRLNKGLFEHVYVVGNGVLWAIKGELDGKQSISSTVLDDDGQVLFQGQYDSVFMIENRIYAGSRARQKTDVYNDQGKKFRTASLFFEIIDAINEGYGKYIETFSSQDRGYGAALRDRDLKVLFTADSDISWLCDNRFRAVIDGGTGVVDITGKPVVPPNYDNIALVRDGGKDYLCAQGRAGCALFDLDGKLLYQSHDYKWLDISDGRLIARFDNSSSPGRALGMDRHDLLGRDDVGEWLPDTRLYRCQDGGGNTVLVREDGSELPLPKTAYIGAFGADRFLVTLYGGKTGLYDSMGKEIIPDVGGLQGSGLPGVLVYTAADHGRTVHWLVDDNGNRLWDQPMDAIQYTGKKGLFEVRLGAKYGLMKMDGSWIWSASDYQELQD